MKKLLKTGLLCASAMLMISGCTQNNAIEGTISPELKQEILSEENTGETIEEKDEIEEAVVGKETEGAIKILLSDNEITVDGAKISENESDAVYVKNDIVYYEEGKDFTYGEGEEKDSHSSEEAAEHKVIHIAKAGTYSVSGKLSKGQIAIDLGEEAKDDPEAIVNLILNGVDINCDVAPGIIFYNVYECSKSDVETATAVVDTMNAGANLILADESKNYVSGSYVAKIYKSVELNKEETEIIDSKKLHKYDGAVYSKMSMNVDGQIEKDGKLIITAENEGLDSELHLTINGGTIKIVSGNDGINTNEDGVSVTTINDGNIRIFVNGKTGEGDGIDSNGWLVINGGKLIAEACSESGDAGIDSDMGIHINGGRVYASGNMLDKISESKQNYVVINFEEKQSGKEKYYLKNADDIQIASYSPKNQFSYMIISKNDLEEGSYTLWKEDIQMEGILSDNEMFVREMGPKPNNISSEKMHEKPNSHMEKENIPEKPIDFEKIDENKKINIEKHADMKDKMDIEKTTNFNLKANGNYVYGVSEVLN